MVKNIPRFKKQSVCWHIQHKYSEEMSKESTIVSTALYFNNANTMSYVLYIHYRSH